MSMPEPYSGFIPELGAPEVLQIMPAPDWCWFGYWVDTDTGAEQTERFPLVGWATVRHWYPSSETYTVSVQALVLADDCVWTWEEWERIGMGENEVGRIVPVADADDPQWLTFLKDALAGKQESARRRKEQNNAKR
jgi:hypothetical protein